MQMKVYFSVIGQMTIKMAKENIHLYLRKNVYILEGDWMNDKINDGKLHLDRR